MKKIIVCATIISLLNNLNYAQNVGIGTNSPSATLHVKGQDPFAWGTTIYPLRIDKADGSPIANLSEDGQLFLSNNITDFATVNLSKMGTTTVPHVILEHEVPGEPIWLNFNHTANNNAWWETTNRTTVSKSSMAFSFDLVNYPLYIESGGNVGINTKTPQQKLDVVGDINFTGTLLTPNISTNGSIIRSGGVDEPASIVSPQSIVMANNRFARSVGGTAAPPNMPKYIPLTTVINIPSTSKIIIDYKLSLYGTNNGCSVLGCGDSQAIIYLILQNNTSFLENIIAEKHIIVRHQRPETFNYKATFDFNPSIIGGGAGSYSVYVYVRHMDGPWIEGRGNFPQDPSLNYLRAQVFPN